MPSLYSSPKIAMSINLQISLSNDSVKYIPVSFHEYGLFLKNSKQGGEGLRIYIPFRKNSLEFLKFVTLLWENMLSLLQILQNCLTFLYVFHPLFYQSSLTFPDFLELKFPDFSWLFSFHELQSSHIFPKSKFKELKGDLRRKLT